MLIPKATPSKFLLFGLIILGVLASSQLAQAKSIRSLVYSNIRNSDAIKTRRGGCAAFGHSCFGGHGKRADSALGAGDEDEAAADDFEAPGFQQQAQGDFGLVFPLHSEPEDYLPKVSNFLKKWLSNSNRRNMAAINQ